MQNGQFQILVVEDEYLIRLTLVEALTDEGYQVLEAESGDAAVAVLAANPEIDLLLTDMQLPGSLDGRRLATHARQQHPDLPILFMTGRPDPTLEAGSGPNERYIAKPFTLTDICQAGRSLIGPST